MGCRWFAPFVAAVLAFVLVSCGEPQRVLQSGTIGANGQVGDVLLRNVHVVPPGGDGYEQGNGAAVRFALFNQAREPDALVDVRTDAAANASLLWDTACDGQAEQVPEIPLLADGGVARLSGALLQYRVQLDDFTRKVRAGTDIPMTFRFERAGEVTLDVPVEAVADMYSDGHPEQCPAATGTSTPSPTAMTLRGTVQPGVEPDCLVLESDGRQYLLLGGNSAVVKAGEEVVLEGVARPGQATTCQQGTPFEITRASPA